MKKYVALLLILSALAAFGVPAVFTGTPDADEYAMFSVTLGAGTDVSSLVLEGLAPFLDERTRGMLETLYEQPPDEPKLVRLACAGDLMCHDLNLEAAFDTLTKTYDFTPFFEHVKPFVSSADLAVANFETTLGGSAVKYQGYPRFNSPDTYLDAVLDAGFDVLTNANNHCLDHGADALSRTNTRLTAKKVPHTGASANAQSRPEPIIAEAGGISFGFAAYTYGSNRRDKNAALNQLYAKNRLNTADIASDILKLRQNGADIVILCVHWGAEYTKKPSERMCADASALAELGADVILGHHPHSLHPVSMLRRGNRLVPVVYSMGNFFCNPSKESCTAEGALLFLNFEKQNDKAVFRGLEYIPTYIDRTRGKTTDYDILPLTGVQSEKRLEDIRSRIIKRIGRSALISPVE